MNRPLAFVCALLAAFVAVSSACVAQPVQQVHFTLDTRHESDLIHASFTRDRGPNNHNDWSTSFPPSEPMGLDYAGFHAAGSHPLHFTLAREAGRLDCSGHGGESYAAGYCGFSADPRFIELLESRRIGRPTADQAFGLMAVNARRELIDALAGARYPMPSMNDLIAMSALNVTGGYIAEMSRAGYRPQTIHSLIEFKALGITPQWIAGFARVGYANLPADELVQIRALGITPDFILGYQRIGYRDLPVDTLVQLKALDITPDFVRAVADGGAMPPVSHLVELKLFDRRHGER